MIDLEHFVTKSVHPLAPGSCLCLLIDTKWGLLPHSETEKSGSPAGLPLEVCSALLEAAEEAQLGGGVGGGAGGG